MENIIVPINDNYINPKSCWTQIYPDFANSVDPDQLASEEANWSGSAPFATEYVNLYQQSTIWIK